MITPAEFRVAVMDEWSKLYPTTPSTYLLGLVERIYAEATAGMQGMQDLLAVKESAIFEGLRLAYKRTPDCQTIEEAVQALLGYIDQMEANRNVVVRERDEARAEAVRIQTALDETALGQLPVNVVLVQVQRERDAAIKAHADLQSAVRSLFHCRDGTACDTYAHEEDCPAVSGEAALRVVIKENEKLRADVERLRKRTHEIADEGNRRVAEAERQMAPELIHARMDAERRQEVDEWLRAHDADPHEAREEDGLRILVHAISENTTTAIHELLRARDEAVRERDEARAALAETNELLDMANENGAEAQEEIAKRDVLIRELVGERDRAQKVLGLANVEIEEQAERATRAEIEVGRLRTCAHQPAITERGRR